MHGSFHTDCSNMLEGYVEWPEFALLSTDYTMKHIAIIVHLTWN